LKKYYVILTGSKNNAGDFLIKYRAKELFATLRPDRDIVDFNAWEPFDDERLSVVNGAEALILMGGPALQREMRPRIYPMVDDLDKIKVPILMMGIGWKSLQGDWFNTYNYPLNEQTLELLRRIELSGYFSSVRDYHTQNALFFHGIQNVIMTGCPACYSIDVLEKDHQEKGDVRDINKVAFSLGVSFLRSQSMEILMKQTISLLAEYLQGKDCPLEVVFQHSLQNEVFLQTHGASEFHLRRHQDFAKWLEDKCIPFQDLSGSAERLVNYYEDVDLHVGFRVHSHLHMNSVAKPSVLLAEDGRGKALRDVLGGAVLDAYISFGKEDALKKIARKMLGTQFDLYVPNLFLPKNVILLLENEEKTGYSRLLGGQAQIGRNYVVMKNFMVQLP